MNVCLSLTCDIIALQQNLMVHLLKALGRPEGSIPSVCMILSNSCKICTVPQNHWCLSECTPTKRGNMGNGRVK